MPSSHDVGTRSPTGALVEYGTASGLAHPLAKSAPQFTVLVGPGWGAKWRRFPSPVVAGGT